MISNIDPVIAKAEALLEHLGSLDEVRRYYEAREMEIHDQVTRMAGASEEGLTEGETKGILKGKLAMAQNLLLMGMDVNAVAKVAELPVEKIMKLQKGSLN
jgi:predicted transposase/invertase (TIGR01784 family)